MANSQIIRKITTIKYNIFTNAMNSVVGIFYIKLSYKSCPELTMKADLEN